MYYLFVVLKETSFEFYQTPEVYFVNNKLPFYKLKKISKDQSYLFLDGNHLFLFSTPYIVRGFFQQITNNKIHLTPCFDNHIPAYTALIETKTCNWYYIEEIDSFFISNIIISNFTYTREKIYVAVHSLSESENIISCNIIQFALIAFRDTDDFLKNDNCKIDSLDLKFIDQVGKYTSKKTINTLMQNYYQEYRNLKNNPYLNHCDSNFFKIINWIKSLQFYFDITFISLDGESYSLLKSTCLEYENLNSIILPKSSITIENIFNTLELMSINTDELKVKLKYFKMFETINAFKFTKKLIPLFLELKRFMNYNYYNSIKYDSSYNYSNYDELN